MPLRRLGELDAAGEALGDRLLRPDRGEVEDRERCRGLRHPANHQVRGVWRGENLARSTLSQPERIHPIQEETCPRARRLFLILALAVLALASAVPAAPATARPTRYVALGDSYSAASGVLPPDFSAPLQCLRSTRNYPHVIAHARSAPSSRTSPAARRRRNDFFEPRRVSRRSLTAVGADAQLVTMTIGGNDAASSSTRSSTAGTAGVLTLGHGSPCRIATDPRLTTRSGTRPIPRSSIRCPRSGEGARRDDRDPRLPVDHALLGRLLLEDADRQRRRRS